MSVFKTIRNGGEGLYKEKGSKFLGFAFPCSSEEDAKKKLIELRKEHHLAVHVCYAFRFGADKNHFRSSDDGEPSNSAGPPILGQIQSFDLTNVLLAVVRYYGGTNLGVGGLINAYRTAAKEAIENSIIAEDEEKQEIRISFSYSQIPTVMKVVKRSNCDVLEQEFKDDCLLRIRYPISNYVLLEELRKVAKVEFSQ